MRELPLPQVVLAAIHLDIPIATVAQAVHQIVIAPAQIVKGQALPKPAAAVIASDLPMTLVVHREALQTLSLTVLARQGLALASANMVVQGTLPRDGLDQAPVQVTEDYASVSTA